ncbi:hypothetical protein ACS0TY_012927 [Phlomoides rotata]
MFLFFSQVLKINEGEYHSSLIISSYFLFLQDRHIIVNGGTCHIPGSNEAHMFPRLTYIYSQTDSWRSFTSSCRHLDSKSHSKHALLPHKTFFEHTLVPSSSSIRDSKQLDTCYAFAVVNCIYANLHIRRGISMKASEQLLLDCLHIHFPPKSGLHERVPEVGYANLFKNAFLYAISMGLLKDQDYPFVGRFKKCERRNKGEVDLIFFSLYEHLRFDEEVIEALRPTLCCCS